MGVRKTQAQFEKDVFERLGSDYELLGPYPGCHGKVPMRHLVCGNTFDKNVHDIISKSSGCPYCFGSKPKLYNEEWVKKNTSLPYHYISGYKNMTTKCVFHCDTCGTDFLQSPARLINQKIYGCDCRPNKQLTHEDFLQTLGKECLEEYEILESYINIDTKIKFRHKTCQTIFDISPYKFIYRHNKKYCPICYYKKSHGEILIATYLENHDIDYQKEFKFPALPNRRYDFYLPNEKIAIEYDGIQHYQYQSFFHNGDINNFYKQQEIDLIKNEYCLVNNIQLFRIPYTEEDNIFQILTEILEEKSSTTIEKYLITE